MRSTKSRTRWTKHGVIDYSVEATWRFHEAWLRAGLRRAVMSAEKKPGTEAGRNTTQSWVNERGWGQLWGRMG